MSLTPYKGICPHCRSTDEQRGNMDLRGLSAGVTVPREPTEAMRDAIWDCWKENHSKNFEYWQDDLYRAMIAAAPSAAPAQNWVESVPVQPVAAVTPDHTLVLYNDDAAQLNVSTMVHSLKTQLAEAKRQLPEGMEHCTIQFKSCKVGHGWLTATNWVQHECIVCELQEARNNLSAALFQIDAQSATALTNQITHVIVDGPNGEDMVVKLRVPLYASPVKESLTTTPESQNDAQ